MEAFQARQVRQMLLPMLLCCYSCCFPHPPCSHRLPVLRQGPCERSQGKSIVSLRLSVQPCCSLVRLLTYSFQPCSYGFANSMADSNWCSQTSPALVPWLSVHMKWHNCSVGKRVLATLPCSLMDPMQ